MTSKKDRLLPVRGSRETLAERIARASKTTTEPRRLFKTRTPRAGSVPAWVYGSSLLIGAALFPFLFCSSTKSTMERRRDVFVAVAGAVNAPIRDLKPFHAEILPKERGGILFLDTQIKACVGAVPHVEALSKVSFPPDEAGEPLACGKGVRDATTSFLADMKACEAGGVAPENLSKCLLRCMSDWVSLVRAVDKTRLDADWVGVRVESLAPLVKPSGS